MYYKIGERIYIRDYNRGWKNYRDTVGRYGTIRSNISSAGNYAVEVDGLINEKSSNIKGVFWINRSFLQKADSQEYVEKRDKDMEVTGNYKIAKVKFLQGINTTKIYAFALFDDAIKCGDTVLCDTQNGYSVATIENIVSKDECSDLTVTKEVVCKVDFTDYDARIKARKDKAALRKEMDRLVKENQELVLFQMLAKENPQMAELLEKYNAIDNSLNNK